MITLTIPGRPPTSNDVRRAGHWTRARDIKAEYGDRVRAAALATWGVPSRARRRITPPVHVTVQDHCRTRNLRDVEATAPAVKAALDALTAYGLWRDDDPTIVAAVTFLAPTKTGIDELVLTITEASPA